MGSKTNASRGPGGNAQHNPGGMVGSRVADPGMAPPAPALGSASWNRPLTQQSTFEQPGFNIQQPTMGMPAFNLPPTRNIPIGTAAQMPGGMFSSSPGANQPRPMKPPGMSDQQYMAVCGGMPPPNPDGPTNSGITIAPDMVSDPEPVVQQPYVPPPQVQEPVPEPVPMQPLSPAAPPLSSGAQNLVDKGVNPMIARLYGGGS